MFVFFQIRKFSFLFCLGFLIVVGFIARGFAIWEIHSTLQEGALLELSGKVSHGHGQS